MEFGMGGGPAMTLGAAASETLPPGGIGGGPVMTSAAKAAPGGGGMGVFMIFFWVVLVAVVVLLISSIMTGRRFFIEGKPKPSADADALEILKRRYASGEIDKHEYELMRQDLQ
jgi:putative membrane protein